MKISARRLCHAIGFPVIIFGMPLVLALLCPIKPAQAVEGAGVCRNAFSSVNCAFEAGCSLIDPEDCTETTKQYFYIELALLAALVVIAFFPAALAAGGGSLVEAGALEETTAAAAEETMEAEAAAEATEETTVASEEATEETLASEEATEEATVESEAAEVTEEGEEAEVTQEGNTGQFASDKANQLQSFFDNDGVVPTRSLVPDTGNCAFVTDEMNGVISTITDGGTPEGYASPNLTWEGLNEPVNDPNFELPTAVEQPQFDYFGATENQYPDAGTFQDTDMQGIANQLGQAGDGSQGIVYVSDGSQAHVFNAVNWDGQTYFVDGQSNQIWTDPGQAAGYENATNLVVKFLQTR